MTPLSRIKLKYSGLQCAHGASWPELWQILQQPVEPFICELAGAGYPAPGYAFTVEEPSVMSLGVDRKLARTMEKQAKLALLGARATLTQHQQQTNHQHSGLYLALPTVNEDVPTWAALEEIQQAGDKANLGEIFLRETPPFSGLSQLNSSACAHISATFGLMGAMSAFSPNADAGLQALIEGILSVAEGENEQALIGGVSPKLNHLLPLHYAAQGWIPPSGLSPEEDSWFPGEGCSFLLACPEDEGVTMVGYGRSFACDEDASGWYPAIHQALAMSGLDASSIGWIFPACPWNTRQRQAQQEALSQIFACPQEHLPLANSAAQVGFLGAAHPLFDAGLAIYGLSHGQCLRWSDSLTAHKTEPLSSPAALILAMGPYGQRLAVILQAGGQA